MSTQTASAYAAMILPEFDNEMATTRRVLERAPEDKWDFKPNPKSNTIGWNVNHLAENPGWVENILTEPSFDYAPAGGEPYQSPKLTSVKDVLELYDAHVASARKAIEQVRDEAINEPWSLLEGGKEIVTMPRAAVMRMFVLSHMVHHRAILTVYYRLNDVPVPAIYGPSADES